MIRHGLNTTYKSFSNSSLTTYHRFKRLEFRSFLLSHTRTIARRSIMSSIDVFPFATHYSRITSICYHKHLIATEAKRKLDISEEKLRKLKEEFAVEEPSLPKEGSGLNALVEAEGILRDTYSHFLLCYESVKDAVV